MSPPRLTNCIEIVLEPNYTQQKMVNIPKKMITSLRDFFGLLHILSAPGGPLTFLDPYNNFKGLEFV